MKYFKAFWRPIWMLLCILSLPVFATPAEIRYACTRGDEQPREWHALNSSGALSIIEDNYYQGLVCWVNVRADQAVAKRGGMVVAMRGLSQVEVSSVNPNATPQAAPLLWRSPRSAAFVLADSGNMLFRLQVVLPIGGNVSIDLEPASDFLAADAFDMAMRDSLLALLAAMAVGGLLCSIAMRNGTIVWYAGLTSGFCLMWALLMGMAVSPTQLAVHVPEISLLLLSGSYATTLICALSFARRYNHLPRYTPRLDKALIYFGWLVAIYATASVIPQFSARAYHYFNLLGLIGMVAILLPGFVSLRQRDYRTSALYLAGWMPLVLAWAGRILLYVDQLSGYPTPVIGLALGLRKLGMLPEWLASPHVRQTALLVQAIMFSVALADQAARLRRHRERSALTDKSTLLPNRAGFLAEVTAVFEAHPQRPCTLILFDIARFSTINETLGYECGDIVLRETGQRLLKRLGQSAVVARVGANQFAVLLEEQIGEGSMRLLIGGMTRHPVVIEGNKLDVSLCGGAANYPTDGRDAELLLRCAEIALAVAKREKQVTMAYQITLERDRRFQLSLLSALRTAVVEGQLQIFLQPKVSLASGRICGAEALLRWQHPTLGLVTPGEFLPFAEQTGLIVELTRWALAESLKIARGWQERNLGLRLSVNLSALDLADATLPARIADVLGSSGADPDLICLELTESELLRDPALAIASMKALRILGFHLSLDDFGTGNSTLRYLQDIPVNEIKIDRSFILNTRNGERGTLLLQSLTAMCHALQLRVVAEGVETEADWQKAVDAACDEVQGYYVAAPMGLADFEMWLLHNQPFVMHELTTLGR